VLLLCNTLVRLVWDQGFRIAITTVNRSAMAFPETPPKIGGGSSFIIKIFYILIYLKLLVQEN
jgi:hypothetical protein